MNRDWNAEPNSPEEKLRIRESDLILEFFVNPWAYEGFKEEERARITFADCEKYRVGSINDEAWYRKQCRFSDFAPSWGEFYLITGEADEHQNPDDWIMVGAKGANHYLFYLRDNEIEVKAKNYEFEKISS